MRTVEFRLNGMVLTRDDQQPRRFGATEMALFDGWIERYHTQFRTADDKFALLRLGTEIGEWLDGPERWLSSLRDKPLGAVIAAFRVTAHPLADDRRFLEVPWELAALNGEFLAAQQALMWAPLRRIGDPLPPLFPDHRHKPGVLFAAAAPRGQYELDFEAEEAAILQATRDTPIDLYVVEEGSLAAVSTAWTKTQSLDVMHLCCHGLGGDDPFLALEGEYGDLKRARLRDLAGAFVHRFPRLLFLSACHTGEGRGEFDSLALGLVQANFPAVLGWADAVSDVDASRFAAALYGHAAQVGATLDSAWAAARFDLMLPERQRPSHWHLARLFLGAQGGGVLAGGEELRITNDPDAGRKAIVEARGQRIEVASRFEFVGRRKELRIIANSFRTPDHAGVLIHGQGRQGKSSLAARVIDRHPHLKQVALFRTCDGRSVLAAIKDEVQEAEPAYQQYSEQCDAFGGIEDAASLRRTLRNMLIGPCGEGGKPILLVLDDFEALLDPPSGMGHWRVKPDVKPALAAIICAFDDVTTPSRLLITSRYDFPFIFEGVELGSRLMKVPLPPMSIADVLKQADRKRRAAESGAFPTDASKFTRHIGAAIAAARNNTGIRDMLFQAVLADADTGERAIAQVDRYFSSPVQGDGALPDIDDEAIRETTAGLIVGALIAMLTTDERALLAALSLFRMPIPLEIWRRHTNRSRGGSDSRLLAFGLWDRFTDIVNPRLDAVAINAVAATQIERPVDYESAIFGGILPDLFEAWGGVDRSHAPVLVDIELTRLALACNNIDILSATATHALLGLVDIVGTYREAAELATRILDCLETSHRSANPDILGAAGGAFYFAGDQEGLRRITILAPNIADDAPGLTAPERVAKARFRLRYGTWLVSLGRPNEALKQFELALSVFEELGDRHSHAVALCEIADLRANKGEIDAALKIHEELATTFESLNDHRSHAVTLGRIARIKHSRGEPDVAIALHEQRLQHFEVLGDRRSRAVTLGDIARIKTERGETDAALLLHEEALSIYEALGARPDRAHVLGDIARIKRHKGEVDLALALHEERLKVVEELGDKHGYAVALGDIADIRKARGEVDSALALYENRLEIFESLGEMSERALTLGFIARIRFERGEVDAALALHEEQLKINEARRDSRARAVTLGDIAQIKVSKGDQEAALTLHEERLKIFDTLGELRERAFTLGSIARIKRSRGESDEALLLLEEEKRVHEGMGDHRQIAVTLGDIAHIKSAKGEITAALRLHQERLRVSRVMNEPGEVAAASLDIGQLQFAIAREHSDTAAFQAAFEAIAESFSLFQRIGHLEGISAAGLEFAQILALAGYTEEARLVAVRAADGYRQLGWGVLAAQAEELLRQLAEQV